MAGDYFAIYIVKMLLAFKVLPELKIILAICASSLFVIRVLEMYAFIIVTRIMRRFVMYVLIVVGKEYTQEIDIPKLFLKKGNVNVLSKIKI